MKPSFILVIISSLSTVLSANNCSISLEPCWNNLEQKNTKKEVFGGQQWVHIGCLTFRKNVNKKIKLTQINLCWHGDKIEQLNGSLYKKAPHQKFIPIEDNLLCDSTWDNGNQHLMLDFSNRKQTLGPVNTFYLVLTVPDHLESTLKKGHFSLTKTCLPEPFSNHQHELTLNIAQFILKQSETSVHS